MNRFLLRLVLVNMEDISIGLLILVVGVKSIPLELRDEVMALNPMGRHFENWCLICLQLLSLEVKRFNKGVFDIDIKGFLLDLDRTL